MPGHRVTEEWLGEPVETLEDLLRPELRAVCVGINPARASVRVGHYYQGAHGQRFWQRLRSARVLPMERVGWEDDTAFALGVGFTDVVKRPTASANEIRGEEWEHGRRLLTPKIQGAAPQLVVFTYPEAAKRYFRDRSIRGRGLLRGRRIGDADVFVMPGPYAPGREVEDVLTQLASLI
jgi:double-stranded uracil-DNA glycosylase